MTHIKRGMRFVHGHILGPDCRAGAICVVTKVTKGVIYYAVSSEIRAHEFFTPDREAKVVRQWLN